MPITKEQLEAAIKTCWTCTGIPPVHAVAFHMEMREAKKLNDNVTALDILEMFDWDTELFMASLLEELNKV